MIQDQNHYDLEKRTLDFSQDLIGFLKLVSKNQLTMPLLDQCLRAGTSIGANYREANGASSKKDFFNKIFICKKEAQETKHWLRMLAGCYPDKKEDLRKFWQEDQELVLIFQKITNTLNLKK